MTLEEEKPLKAGNVNRGIMLGKELKDSVSSKILFNLTAYLRITTSTEMLSTSLAVTRNNSMTTPNY